jgi:hypothetical protein
MLSGSHVATLVSLTIERVLIPLNPERRNVRIQSIDYQEL